MFLRDKDGRVVAQLYIGFVGRDERTLTPAELNHRLSDEQVERLRRALLEEVKK
jgi:hypothetical protein